VANSPVEGVSERGGDPRETTHTLFQGRGNGKKGGAGIKKKTLPGSKGGWEIFEEEHKGVPFQSRKKIRFQDHPVARLLSPDKNFGRTDKRAAAGYLWGGGRKKGFTP